MNSALSPRSLLQQIGDELHAFAQSRIGERIQPAADERQQTARQLDGPGRVLVDIREFVAKRFQRRHERLRANPQRRDHVAQTGFELLLQARPHRLDRIEQCLCEGALIGHVLDQERDHPADVVDQTGVRRRR